MEIVYFLVPVSMVLVGLIVAGYLWASRRGQFDDLERHGRDILQDEDD